MSSLMIQTKRGMFLVIYYSKFNADLIINDEYHARYLHQMNSSLNYYNRKKILKNHYSTCIDDSISPTYH